VLSLFPLLSSTLSGPSASEVTTLLRYTNKVIIIIIIVVVVVLTGYPRILESTLI